MRSSIGPGSLLSRASHSDSIVRRFLFPWVLPPLFLSHIAIFQGPLTRDVQRSLYITNLNADPVAYRAETTAPEVRPSRL